ncbi:MAG: hypothetical protein R3220_03170 [Balneolaceae bacterium]|nr:hypothetical protein [Balneolaceae bacterium]
MKQLQEMWYWGVVLFALVGLLVFNNCGDSLTVPDKDDNKNEILSEVIFMKGRLIATKYSDWPIPENDVPEIDTTRIGFLMKVQSINGEENSIRIYGLEGGDVGKREDYLFPGCTHPDDCRIIGTLTDEALQINLTNNGRTYQAEGSISNAYNPYVHMTATYNYQNTTIEYELEGGTSEE